jgi:hypothetical protein
MNPSERDTWLDRSRQRWKLQVAQLVLVGGTACGMWLFFRAVWPDSFYGALLVLAATPLAVAFAASVRCVVCGHRVALDAPIGRWWSHMSVQKVCPECLDDGTNRPVSPTELPVWFQVVRELAAQERTRSAARRRMGLRLLLAAGVVCATVWAALRLTVR